MKNVQMACAPRQFEEPLNGSDLLCVDVLGTQFIVRWGREVTREQRQAMSAAWARCSSSTEPLVPQLPNESTGSLPFSASVAYRSPKPDVGTFQLQAASFEELAENLTSRLTVAAILAKAGDLTMLHACGVADPATGAVVALVAKSGTGKTTAASVLAQTYGYVTDETLAIGADGSVVPYPKPLSRTQGPGEPKRQIGPDALGLLPAPAKPFIRSIVLLKRVQGEHAVPVLERVPLADALLALIPETSSQAELTQPLQSLCRLVDSVGGVWQVTYSEATDLPAVLEPLFRTQPKAEPEWEARASEEADSRPIPSGWVRRAAVKDAVAFGDELLVMLDSEIVKLSGIGPAIWEASTGPVRPDQLAEQVGNVHGRPEGYRDAVAVGIGELIAKAVLEKGRQ